MKPLSPKQEAFKEHLLRQLGFTEGDFLFRYLELLGAKASRVRKEVSFKDKTTGEWVFAEVSNTVIDELMNELNHRRNRRVKILNSRSPYISATNLASFTFCSASYSIANTFEIKETVEMEIGTDQHERQWLLDESYDNFTEHGDFTYIDEYENEESKEFFRELRYSTKIFSGHQNQEKKVFYSKSGKFIGQPDYVFRNRDGNNFIVEEKFHFSKGTRTNFNNHKVQLASYLLGLDDFDAKYGYLVYWKMYGQLNRANSYQYTHYERRLNCEVHKIEVNDALRNFVRSIYKKVQSLNKGETLVFDASKLNPYKCANCSVKYFCGHKTGKFNSLTFPYDDKFLKLFDSQYIKPE